MIIIKFESFIHSFIHCFFVLFLDRLGGAWTTSLRTCAMDTTSSHFWKSSPAITWYVICSPYGTLVFFPSLSLLSSSFSSCVYWSKGRKKKKKTRKQQQEKLSLKRRQKDRNGWTRSRSPSCYLSASSRSLCFANHVDRIWIGGAGPFGPFRFLSRSFHGPGGANSFEYWFRPISIQRHTTHTHTYPLVLFLSSYKIARPFSQRENPTFMSKRKSTVCLVVIMRQNEKAKKKIIVKDNE